MSTVLSIKSFITLTRLCTYKGMWCIQDMHEAQANHVTRQIPSLVQCSFSSVCYERSLWTATYFLFAMRQIPIKRLFNPVALTLSD